MNDLNIFTLTAAIADPVRLSVMIYLIRGRAGFQEIQHHLEISQSNLSNHLKVLSDAGLIKRINAGRRNSYEIAGADIAQLIELLLNLQKTSPKNQQTARPIAIARTCYDHIAGNLGVAIFNSLMADEAIKYAQSTPNPMNAPLELGHRADKMFNALGVDISAVQTTRRKYAFACLDWTERKPHLAGALGAALCDAMIAQKWVLRNEDKRILKITDTGIMALKEIINLDFLW
jgi:DNA-binding transcriptional ArsR family regulator